MDVVKRGSRVLRIFAAKAAPTLTAVARDELLVARKNLRQRNSQYTVHGEPVEPPCQVLRQSLILAYVQRVVLRQSLILAYVQRVAWME